MTGNIIGEEFKEYVNKQIQSRQKMHGSGLSSNRTPEQINYLSNRNAWIKMASSVSIEEDIRITNIKLPDAEGYKGINLAKKSILFNTLVDFTSGGGLDNANKYILPVYNTRYGIGDGSIWNNSAYGLGGTQFGLQPPPGITSISINTVNRGSIRKATVTMKAYNKFQFELIELLYLRLGFTMLLEWGWNKYINDDISEFKVENLGNTLIEDYWFNEWNNNATQRTVLKFIEDYREFFNGNYDGFFGKVCNYKWEFQSDGSYDIKLDLITLGDVVESLQTRIAATSNFLPSGSDNPIASSMGQTTVDQWLFNKLSNENNFQPKTNYIIISDQMTFQEGMSADFSDLDNKYSTKQSLSKPSSTQTRFENIPLQYKYYVTFGEFIKQIKYLCIPYIKNGTTQEPQLYFDEDIEHTLVKLFPNQISIDPRVCLFNPYWSKKDFKNLDSQMDYLKPYVINYNNKGIMYGQLMNLYLNFDFIIQTLKSNVNGKNLSLYKFLENICDGINSAIGGVNKIQPIIKDDNIITFIDQALQSSPTLNGGDKNDKALIEVYGYNQTDKTSNFVKNILFETKLTKETSAMISIGATAGGSETSIKNGDATAFSKWNEGLKDRFCQQIIDPSEIPVEVPQDIKEQTIGDITANIILKRGGKYDYIIKKYYPDLETNNPLISNEKIPYNEIGLLVDEYIKKLPSQLTLTVKSKQAAYEIAKLEIAKRVENNKNKIKSLESYQTDSITAYLKYIIDAFGGTSSETIYYDNKLFQYNSSIKLYYNFDKQFIEKGQTLYKTYISAKSLQKYQETSERNKIKEQSSQIGFLPLEFTLTCDGISGMKIYNKLNISQDFLPSNYPESFDFLIVKLNHKVDQNGWDTEIGTLSTSNIDDVLDEGSIEKNNLVVNENPERIAINDTVRKTASHLKNKLFLTKEQTAGLMGNIQQESSFKLTNQNKNQAYGLVQFDIQGDFGGSTNNIETVKATVGSTVESQLNALSTTKQFKDWKSRTKSSSVMDSASQFALIYEYYYAKDENAVAEKINKANKGRETMAVSLAKASFGKRKRYALTFYNQFIPGGKLDWTKL